MTLVGLMMVGLMQRFRPFLCRRRRLWRHPVDPRQGHDGRRPPGAAVRAQTARDHDQPRLRRFGRHLFALALSRRDARRGLRVARDSRPSQRRPDFAVGGDRRHGGDGRRGHRRRHDRHHHGVRDDARLRDHRAGDRRRRGRGRGEARAHRRDDLHHQAAPPRPPASRRSVTSISISSSRRRTSWSGGSSSPRRARRCASAWAGKTSTICAPSSSSTRAGSSA